MDSCPRDIRLSGPYRDQVAVWQSSRLQSDTLQSSDGSVTLEPDVYRVTRPVLSHPVITPNGQARSAGDGLIYDIQLITYLSDGNHKKRFQIESLSHELQGWRPISVIIPVTDYKNFRTRRAGLTRASIKY